MIKRIREQIAKWLRDVANRIDPGYGEAGFSTINYRGEPLVVKKLGRVVKVTSPAEYDPDVPIKKGGHVVRLMPKQLKKIKDAQDGEV